jgi:cyclopropane-fatty-acyl-phospholipid synthase
LAIYLAEICGARSMGITLSQEQLAMARGRVAEKGLDDRVAFFLQDYRDVTGRFDRIVSVGMFEHVGVGFYDSYFRKCADLLADDGVFVLHSIGRSGRPGITNPWIAKCTFPGGYIPALSEVLERRWSVRACM